MYHVIQHHALWAVVDDAGEMYHLVWSMNVATILASTMNRYAATKG